MSSTGTSKKIGPIVIHKDTRFTYPGSRHYRSFQVARESENRKDFLRWTRIIHRRDAFTTTTTVSAYTYRKDSFLK